MPSMLDIFQEMDALRREVDRAFRDAGLSSAVAPLHRFAFLPGRSARGYPLINVHEDASNLYVDALAPGIDPKSLEVNVVQDQLTISGEKIAPGTDIDADAIHRNERGSGRFSRKLTLPAAVDSQSTTAQYKDGIIRITLPKAESAKPKKIAVSVA